MHRTRPLRAALFASALVALSPGVSHANGRFPAAQQVVLGPGARSDVIALRVTFGLLVSRDAGRTFRWYCEDLIYFPFVPGLGFDPPVEVTALGDITVGFEDGAHALTDGCDVRDLASVTHREITDLAATPDGAMLYATDSTTGSRSYVLRADTSLAFRRMGDGVDRLRFLTVEVAASRPDRVYASGFDDTPSRTPRVLLSDDGGGTFRELSTPGGFGDSAYVSGVDPADPDVLYVRVIEGFGSALLRSGDGGAHFEVVARTRDAMVGFAISDDGRTVWYGSADEGLFRSTDGGQRFTQIGMLPTHGLRFHAGVLWLVTDWVRQPWALGRSMDGGEHFESVLRFEDVLGPPACARPSEGTVICGERWPTLQRELEPPTPRMDAGNAAPDAAGLDAVSSDAPRTDVGAPSTDAGMAATSDSAVTARPPAPSDCGCHMGPAPVRVGGWIALALAALVRRRRLGLATAVPR
ncbi:MAG: hypothetical protein EPO40_04255 [Myxococcaceae bacterium]|nr:MAG: hypothetical protein EPO40_04255 [Myxococcaceae bacterium]